MTTEKKPMGRPPERIHVTIRFKMALGATPTSVDLPWPKTWPLPGHGDMVRHGDLFGIVQNLDFEPENGRIVINCR